MVNDVLTANDSADAGRVASAVSALLALPSQLLDSKGAGKDKARKVQARARDLRAAVTAQARAATTSAASDQPPDPAPPAPGPEAHARAARMHAHLSMGNVSRAAKCLDALPIAEPTADVVEALRALHPQADPPHIPDVQAQPLDLDDDTFEKLLKRLPRSSAPGLSGWTYEHIKAAAFDGEARDALRRLFSAIITGRLPQLPDLLDGYLLGLTKPGGRGIRPIAVTEV